ncbi:Phosphoribosyl-dephospho-CoA transferase [Caballeronia arationis]|jgi:phosphoribosyl-dephospho-CoA transferase|uniref:Phosphoribosyl-dephospho-CoA transferase n=1 Tax=Caballeronia arationis TaxID=1777142 RepID=A0A7Z7N5A8_9BURK|nr:malonate decarboxylase holo-ACP synthase [Caballeronia arationis]SAK68225.1 Phosphoribosyl-dephospho-CoA transferase [Caballeronia arationis]SOE81957.1 phosphoribosyl-dephospho-CoA transferase [Caballeronia arationis]
MGRAVTLDLRPHDLLRLVPDAPAFADAPAWVADALARAPWVVVRRAPRLDAAIPVGVRGSTRSERFGTWLHPRDVASVIAPEDLRSPASSRSTLPAFALLRAVAPLLDATGCVWGPTGSAGFELASGVATVTPASDLDLVMRAPEPLARERAAALFDTLSNAARHAATRIDVQIETRDAAFSLGEFARPNLRVMLRCADGPKLVADPWRAESVA